MKLPCDVLQAVEAAIDNLQFGVVSLLVTLHDGQPKYRITREESIIPGKPTSGSERATTR